MGGTPVIDYYVWWDRGTAYWEFRQIATTNSHRSTGLTTGTVYSFYVLSRNAFGFSIASQALSVLAATAPSIPVAPVTTLSGSNIVISWTAPANNGSPITSYQIAIMQSNGSTFT